MTSQSRPATILVVDDDPGMLLLCNKVLERAGYKVLQASGSSEALKLHATHPDPIDLVITDIILPPPGFQLSVENNPYPRVNGGELVDRLLGGKQPVRILLMSSTPAHELRNTGLIRADLPFVAKPFSGPGLLELVQQVLATPPPVADPNRNAKSGQADVDWFG